MHNPTEIEFSKSWAPEGWSIECGRYYFPTMCDLLDYYGITECWGVYWDIYEDWITGKQTSCIVYHGIATKNLDKETAYKNNL